MDPGPGNYGSMEIAKKKPECKRRTLTTLRARISLTFAFEKIEVATHPFVASFALGFIGLGPYLRDEEGNERDHPSGEHRGHWDREKESMDRIERNEG